MEVAILIDSHRLVGIGVDNRLGLVAQIDTHATGLGLDIDEGDVVFGEHRMGYTTHLNLEGPLIDFRYTSS